MNAAATPNATHMPSRCSRMCSAWASLSVPGSAAGARRAAPKHASDSATSVQVHARPQDHRRERDLDEVEEAERIERPAGEGEQTP